MIVMMMMEVVRSEVTSLRGRSGGAAGRGRKLGVMLTDPGTFLFHRA